MNIYRFRVINRILACLTIVAFSTSLIISPQVVKAQTVLNLPKPGTRISLSPSSNPAIIKGITIHPSDPFLFDFIVHPGDENLKGEDLTKEANKLIKYFMAALTVPEDEMWVNLSPYEKDRIIPEGFGNTEMGRDFFADREHIELFLKMLSEIGFTCPVFLKISPVGGVDTIEKYLEAADPFRFIKGFIFNLAPGKMVPLNTSEKIWKDMPGAVSGKPVEGMMNSCLREMFKRMDKSRYKLISLLI